jgi:maltose O-acetyltransferase
LAIFAVHHLESGGYHRIHPDISLLSPFFCEYGYNIEIGARVFIGPGCHFYDICGITIGQEAVLQGGVRLMTAWPDSGQTSAPTCVYGSPITIGDGAFISCGVVIFPGVLIGSRSYIGPGSIVDRVWRRRA